MDIKVSYKQIINNIKQLEEVQIGRLRKMLIDIYKSKPIYKGIAFSIDVDKTTIFNFDFDKKMILIITPSMIIFTNTKGIALYSIDYSQIYSMHL